MNDTKWRKRYAPDGTPQWVSTPAVGGPYRPKGVSAVYCVVVRAINSKHAWNWVVAGFDDAGYLIIDASWQHGEFSLNSMDAAMGHYAKCLISAESER